MIDATLGNKPERGEVRAVLIDWSTDPNAGSSCIYHQMWFKSYKPGIQSERGKSLEYGVYIPSRRD